MAKKGGSPMVSDSNAAPAEKLSLPSGNQNMNSECGYVGEGSASLDSEAYTKGPSDISGGN